MPPWLLLLYALPARQNTERVNLWRKLKKFGAVALQTAERETDWCQWCWEGRSGG